MTWMSLHNIMLSEKKSTYKRLDAVCFSLYKVLFVNFGIINIQLNEQQYGY